MSSSVAVRNVTKEFHADGHHIVALKNVSLDVKPGEFLVLVGPSGCGKSTLLNLIAGLDQPDSGQVMVDNQSIVAPGPDRAVVFQDGALFPWLSVIQNVQFPLRQVRLPRKEARERSRELLEMVGLGGFLNQSIHQLSGGMRQRVAIARALAMRPKVILMDEPFSALDAITREELYGQLQDIWQDQSTTVVFVTHNVREAVVLADRVVLMSPRPGRITETYTIGILPPRAIDDTDVARLAKQISLDMRYGPVKDDYTGANI